MWQNINQCWPRNVIGGSTVWSFYKFPTGSCPKINCPKKHIVNSFLITHHGSFLRGRGYHFHSCLHIGACGTIPNLSLCGTCHLGATVVRLAHGGLGGSNVKGFEFPIGINPPLIKTARTMGRKMRNIFVQFKNLPRSKRCGNHVPTDSTMSSPAWLSDHHSTRRK